MNPQVRWIAKPAKKCWRSSNRHGRKGRTILIVTHDLNVARHCRREIYLRDRRIVTPETDVALAHVAGGGA